LRCSRRAPEYAGRRSLLVQPFSGACRDRVARHSRGASASMR
jgi:hypothetical protein